jgi:hypothetical protein
VTITNAREAAPMTDQTETLIARADALGTEHGRAAGSWVIDGNTSAETAQAIVRGYEDGDPGIMDMMPSPLSGEWADGMTPARLYESLGIPDANAWSDEVCDMYEAAYAQAYWDQVIADARGFGHVA